MDTTPTPPTITLNEDQQSAVDMVKDGKSIYITGPAGSGKSLTISKIIEQAREMDEEIHVTASTGVAASQLRGLTGVRTFHSWAGIGLGKYAASAHAKFIKRNQDTRDRIIGTDILVIDEISMIDPQFLAKVNDVVQIVRSWDPSTRHIAKKPFGGIQLVLTGDFGQLPPVQKGKSGAPKYLFQDPLWKKLVDDTVVLTNVYRQQDQEFVDLLMRIRSNRMTDADVATLRGTASNKLGDGKLKPTVLFCRNCDVDRMNLEELRKLEGPCYKFVANDRYETEQAKKDCRSTFASPETLPLKVGAQVMLTINQNPNAGLINGSRGVVTDITMADPAIQGSEAGITVTFANGQQVFYNRHLQESQDDNGKVVASRKQFPFKLAWCMTIHKSQGMTIDLLDIDLRGAFEVSQAYVAISRGVGLDKMRIRNFRKDCVLTSHAVLQFERDLLCKKRQRESITADASKKPKTS